MPATATKATAQAAKVRSPSPEPPRYKSPEVERAPPPKPAAADSSRGKTPAPDPPKPEEDEVPEDGLIKMETFMQIIELDEEEDDYEFSWTMADAYFQQALTTFDDMDAAFAAKDLAKLSSLGHFLKGSSAALGVIRVADICEKMQHYGHLRDEEKNIDLTPEVALKTIAPLLSTVKTDFVAAQKWLRNWFYEHGVEDAKDDE